VTVREQIITTMKFMICGRQGSKSTSADAAGTVSADASSLLGLGDESGE
jgi:hypothetical protein